MLRKRNTLRVFSIVLVTGFSVSCNKVDDFFDFSKGRDNAGFLFTSSNDKGKNSILIYKQEANGTLTYKTSVNSGGAGAGAGLGSQGAIVLDKKHHQLYTVNAGSNSISSFKVYDNGLLTLNQTISSEGTAPISLSVHNSLLYVVNDGGSICGFNIADNGDLSKIDGSVQPLSAPDADPAEILFKPDGSAVIVTEKVANKIALFKINGNGVAQPGEFHDAVAKTPFGFVFANGKQLVVTNAFGGAPKASTVSSFSVNANGDVNMVSNTPDYQAAACWVVLTKDNDYAFVSNTGSNSISSLKVGDNGKLQLVDSVATATGGAPADIIVSDNGKYAYNVNGMSHSIGQYKILPNGRLNSLGDLPGLPVAAAGIVAW